MTTDNRTGAGDLFMDYKGKDFVLYRGLLAKAHDEGLRSIDTEIVQFPTAANERLCVVKAVVHMDDGEGSRTRRFTGYGDASPDIKGNLGGMIAPHWIRMAETRAKARALRDAVNVGVTAFDELGDLMQGDDDPKPKTTTKPKPRQQPTTIATGKLGEARAAIVAWVKGHRDAAELAPDAVGDADFLVAASGGLYGKDGANTIERVKAMRESIEGGAVDLNTGRVV